jgi:hypothetical protein
VKLDELVKILLMNGLPDGVTFEGENVICVLSWSSQGMLPQTLGIVRLFPDAMIAFINRMLQREGGAFERSHVVSEIHEQSGIRRKFLHPTSDFQLKLIARSHVDFRFLEADGTGLPDARVADANERKKDNHSGEPYTSVDRFCTQSEINQHRDSNHERRKQLQSVANVVVGERPPVGNEDRHASIGNRQCVKQERNEQEQKC